MTDEDRSAFAIAAETAQRRLPKGHKLAHVRWHDGVFQFTSRPIKGEQEPQGWQTLEPIIKQPKKAKRGSVQVELPL